MKRKLTIILLAVLLLAGCAGGASDGNVVEISERFFSTQVHSIMTNRDEYLGRTIQYEGLFRSVHWSPTHEYYHYVVRITEDCCSPGGIIGFEVHLTNDMEPLEHDAWARVTGVLEEYVAEDGITYLRLALTSLEELEERGEEFVPGM